MKKMKYSEYVSRLCIDSISFSSLFTNGPNRLECLSLASISSLMLFNDSFKSYEENEVFSEYVLKLCINNTFLFITYQWAQ